MWPLVQLFIDIAFHRRGPQDVPDQVVLLYAGIAVAFAVSIASLLLLGYGTAGAVLDSVLHLVLFLGFYRAMLAVMGCAMRFRQTAVALLGTSVLLSLIAMPLLPAVAAAADGEALSGPAALVLFALLLWSIDIAGFIVSRAIERHYLFGVMIAIGFFLVEALARRLLAAAG